MWKNISNGQNKVGIRCVDDRRDDNGTWARAYAVADHLLNAGFWNGEGAIWIADPHKTLASVDLYGKRPDELVRGVDWGYYSPPPAPVSAPSAPVAPCECAQLNPFAWLLEAIAQGMTLDDLKAQGLVDGATTLDELLPRCMCGSSPTPSARAEVVAEAVAEDEAAAHRALDFTVENNDPQFMALLDDFNEACYNGNRNWWLGAEQKLKEYGAWVQSVDGREYWRHPATNPTPVVVEAESTAEDESAVDAIDRHFEEAMYDDDWEDDWYDASDQNWYYMDAPPPPQPINHVGRRADYKAWRHNAIFFGGNLPYVPCFGLAADVATFEGEVYRIINPADFNYDDIPF